MKSQIILTALALVSSLSAEPKILALSGSTRKDSLNQKLVMIAGDLARQKGATVTYIDLKDYQMPFYDGDIETSDGMPKRAKDLRDKMIASDGIIISTPEYNGHTSAVLKNAIDWVSRGENGGAAFNAFKGKSFALLSASPSRLGGKRAIESLAKMIEELGGKVVATKVSVANSFEAFNADGSLKDQALKKQIEQEVDQLIAQTSNQKK